MLKFVVGLFASKGIAEDAINRLRYEGVPEGNVFPMLIHVTAPPPSVVPPGSDTLSVAPLVVDHVRDTFAPFIRNGETAVYVRAHSEDEVDLAVATIRQYAPIKIRVVSSGEGALLGHDIL
jgi:hypothetical protein